MIKKIFLLLSPHQRRRFYTLQILVVLMGIMEIFGIASIGPFMALVADPSLLEKNEILREIYQFSNFHSANNFLIASGFFVLMSLGLSSLISIVTSWRLSLFAIQTGTQFANRIFYFYLQQGWLFHANTSTAQLTKKIATECNRVTFDIILPLMQLNARIVTSGLISLAVFIYDPLIALVGLTIFIAGYVIVYFLVKKRIVENGDFISKNYAIRFRLMNESFGGIKDLILLGRVTEFTEKFDQSGGDLAKAQGLNTALAQTPRYFMEFVAFGAMIGLVLTLLIMHDGLVAQVLPVLAIYALAGFKLLPALQQIYASFSQIKGAGAALDSIKDDLMAAQKLLQQQSLRSDEIRKIQLEDFEKLSLNNVFFSYPGAKDPALKNLSLTIPINATVGFVGASGSGKSTVVDAILGLIYPEQGQLKLDEFLINSKNKRAWQNNIGYVPQSIFLSEGTIAENVAFGIKSSEINMEQVKKSITLAHLDDLIASLPEGLNTKVGERGIKLSGGQRQRIGIARALYGEPKVLVFDEATSALDGVTEKIVMDAIHELGGQRTIILIAHRLKTVQQCQKIFFMDKGMLIDEGTYSELIERNAKFRKMSKFA